MEGIVDEAEHDGLCRGEGDTGRRGRRKRSVTGAAGEWTSLRLAPLGTVCLFLEDISCFFAPRQIATSVDADEAYSWHYRFCVVQSTCLSAVSHHEVQCTVNLRDLSPLSLNMLLCNFEKYCHHVFLKDFGLIKRRTRTKSKWKKGQSKINYKSLTAYPAASLPADDSP